MDDLDQMFDEFWAWWPRGTKYRKKKKGHARAAFTKIMKQAGDPAGLLKTMKQAIEVQKHSTDWDNGFCPLPATWLNSEGWGDEIGIDEYEAAQRTKRNEARAWNDQYEAALKHRETNSPRYQACQGYFDRIIARGQMELEKGA